MSASRSASTHPQRALSSTTKRMSALNPKVARLTNKRTRKPVSSSTPFWVRSDSATLRKGANHRDLHTLTTHPQFLLTAGEYEEEWKEAKQQADEVLAEIEEEGALEAKGGAEENKEQPPEEKVLVQLLPGLALQPVC